MATTNSTSDLIQRCNTIKAAVKELNELIQQDNAETREEVSPIHRLPPEVWVEIFQNLRPRDMSNVRLVCRSFNEIVFSFSRLMESYPIRINQDMLDNHRNKIHAIGLSSCRYTTLVLNDVKLVNPGVCYWFSTVWTNAGHSIQTLHLKECNIPTGLLVELLRNVPNVSEVIFYPSISWSFNKPDKLNFVLNNLRRLFMSIENEDNVQVLGLFQAICSKVIDFQFNAREGIEENVLEYEQAILAFIRAHRQSLEEADIFFTKNIFLELTQIPNLTLKRLTLGERNIPEETLIFFTKNTPTIEELSLPNMEIENSETLIAFGKNLPNLKTFRFSVSRNVDKTKDYEPKFLQYMPKLEHFKISYRNLGKLRLERNGFHNPYLQRFKLQGIELPQYVLSSYLNQSSTVSELRLHNCRLEYASDIFHLITQLKSLKKLELCYISFSNHDSIDMNDIVGFSNLQYLKLEHFKDWEGPNEYIEILINICPNLNHLHVTKIADGGLIREVCQSLRKLSIIQLEGFEDRESCLSQLLTYQEETRSLKTLVIVEKIDMAGEKLRMEVLFKRFSTVNVDVHASIIVDDDPHIIYAF